MEKKLRLRFLIITMLLLFSTHLLKAQPKAPDGKKWELVEELSDEFNFWDSDKWQHSLWNYGPPNVMKKSQSTVANGNLQIKAELNDDANRWMKTGRIVSKARISFPMYTECFMKASNISAYNTFWLNNGDINNRNEIDVCENNANPTAGDRRNLPFETHANIHHAVNGNNITSPSSFDTRDLPNGSPNKNKKMNEAYFKIGVHWENNRDCHWYLDGVYAGTSVAGRDFTRSLNILFDLWTNSWTGFATKNSIQDDSKNTMYVDWVHTYKLVDSDSTNDKVAFSNVLSELEQQTSYTFDINYSASTEREIVVEFWSPTAWLQNGKVTVPRGSGTTTVTVNLNNEPPAGQGYVLKTHIRPTGTTWQEALDNDQINNITINGTLSTNDIENSNYIIYPNPSNGVFTINSSRTEDLKIQVFNLLGERVYKKVLEVNTNSINLSNLNSGMYLMSIETPSKTTVTKKIMIEK